MLGRIAVRRSPLFSCSPQNSHRLTSRLYGHGLNALGLDPGRVFLVETQDDKQALWAIEEALRSGVPCRRRRHDRNRHRSQIGPAAESRRRRIPAGFSCWCSRKDLAGSERRDDALAHWCASNRDNDRFGLIARLAMAC